MYRPSLNLALPILNIFFSNYKFLFLLNSTLPIFYILFPTTNLSLQNNSLGISSLIPRYKGQFTRWLP
jgi:hypothetical protein